MKGRRGDDAVVWVLRLVWVTLPFTLGPALAGALDDLGSAVRTVASVQLWAGWAVGVAAVLIPHPIALTVMRMLAPAALASALGAAAAGQVSVLAATSGAVALAFAFYAPVGARWVNGPAYPNERRFLLRVPGPLLFGPLGGVWALMLAGMAAGPLLLADGRWAGAVAATVVGWPLSWVLARSVHNLSRRWAVFVPAGMVLHDPISLVDPVLFARQHVTSLAPARTGGDAVDLTQRSPGLALELTVDPPAGLTLLAPGRRLGRQVEAAAVLFTPTRPGDVLDEARRRRLAVRTSRRTG